MRVGGRAYKVILVRVDWGHHNHICKGWWRAVKVIFVRVGGRTDRIILVSADERVVTIILVNVAEKAIKAILVRVGGGPSKS